MKNSHNLKLNMLILGIECLYVYFKTIVHLREPLREEAVAVDFDELTVRVAVRQLNDQFLCKCFTQRRLACTRRPCESSTIVCS